MQRITHFLGTLYTEWKKDDVLRHSATIAYYTVFSLPALLMIILSVAGSVIGTQAVRDEVFGTVETYIGSDITELLQITVENMQREPASLGAAVIGVILLIFGAAGVIRELRVSLNKILGHGKPKKATLFLRLWNFLLSLILLILTAFLIITSIFASTLLTIIQTRVTEFLGIPIDRLELTNLVVTFVALTAIFFLLYVSLPSIKYPLKIILPYSAAASAMFLLGTSILSFYIGYARPGHVYGIAASMLVLLLWIYFAAVVLLVGAELIEITDRKK